MNVSGGMDLVRKIAMTKFMTEKASDLYFKKNSRAVGYLEPVY